MWATEIDGTAPAPEEQTRAWLSARINWRLDLSVTPSELSGEGQQSRRNHKERGRLRNLGSVPGNTGVELRNGKAATRAVDWNADHRDAITGGVDETKKSVDIKRLRVPGWGIGIPLIRSERQVDGLAGTQEERWVEQVYAGEYVYIETFI